MARGRRRGGRGGGNGGSLLQSTLDTMSSGIIPPMLVNGVYTFSGNQMSFIVQAESLQTVSEMTAGQPFGTGILQANITLVGTKVKTTNNCCFCLTILLGSFLILPLMVMCCGWWKKIVYPAYELAVDTYKSMATFIASCPNITSIMLVVADNNFNAEKARILQQALAKSRITTFGFTNRALDINYLSNEADDFRNNMQPIKSLNMTSSIIWGNMILL